jgi:hypothetical protein
MNQKDEVKKYNSTKNTGGYLHRMDWKISSKHRHRRIGTEWIDKHVTINYGKTGELCQLNKH